MLSGPRQVLRRVADASVAAAGPWPAQAGFLAVYLALVSYYVVAAPSWRGCAMLALGLGAIRPLCRLRAKERQAPPPSLDLRRPD